MIIEPGSVSENSEIFSPSVTEVFFSGVINLAMTYYLLAGLHTVLTS